MESGERAEASRWISYLLIAGAMCVHGAFWISLQYGFLDPLFNDSTHRLPRGLDFYAVYEKSYKLSLGESLYTRVNPDNMVVPYSAPYYRYLPTWAWLMGSTLCRLDPEPAYWLWVVLCELMLLLCLGRFLVRTSSLRDRAWLTVFWLCFSPYYVELFMGQFTLVTVSLIAMSWFAFDRGDDVRGSIWLTVSVCLKYLGIVFLPPLVLHRRWRPVLAVVVAVLAVCALYFPFHAADLPLFLKVFSYGTPNQFHAGNLGLMGFLWSLALWARGHSVPPGILQFAMNLFPWVLLLWLSRLTWRYRSDTNLVPLLMLWLTAYFMVGADVYEHHWVMLLPVFSWAWLLRPSRVLILFYALLALPTIFVLVDLPDLPRQQFAEVETLWWRRGYLGRIFLYHAWKIAPTIGLFVWLLRLLERPGDGEGTAGARRSPLGG